MFLLLSILVLIIWVRLFLAPGLFWRIERASPPPNVAPQPSVVVVIPSRNEAPRIADTLRSLWQQDYPGRFSVIVVDDRSDDDTAGAAQAAVRESGREQDTTIVVGSALPQGWAGKVWAMHQGLERAEELGAEFILFSDADIFHGEGVLDELVRRAVSESRDMVSLMVRLRCDSPAEKLMIPAFVFFFRMLYPFRRVNDINDPLAAAAGGTMLVRRSALDRIGGLHSIRDAIIDDCSLAKAAKRGGHSIWLGMSEASSSTRRYDRLSQIIRMISRTAYAELKYSPARLAGCVAGLALTFLAPPLLAASATGLPSLLAGSAWLLMCAMYAPMLRFYGRSLLWAPLLPVTASLYLWATLLSAWRHHLGARREW